MYKAMLALFLACALAWVLTPWVRRKAFDWGAVDRPDERKVHTRIMPRMGGLAIYISFVLTVLLTVRPTPALYGLLVGATIIVLVGIMDDIRGLSPRVKLVGQIVAALSVLPFGIDVNFITNPFNGYLIYLGWLGIPATVLWLVSVTNAVNLIDGLDGLAGGISCIAALTMAAVALTQWHVFGISGQLEVVMLALILAGSIIGFLRHNFHPAKIFLGDTGSMLLGFTLGVLAIISLTKSVTAISVIIPMIIMGIPLLDTTFAVLRRYHKHRPIFQPDKEHLHHQLMAMGLSHKQTVLAIYGLSTVLGLSAVVLNLISTDQALILLVILASVIIVTANKLGVLGGGARAGRQISKGYQGRSSNM